MATVRIVERDGDRARGYIAPEIEASDEDADLCYDTRDHQGTPPRGSRTEQREEDEDWVPKRQPPRPAPFLRERRDNDFGGRLAKRPQLHDARETAHVGGATADPAQGHTVFLDVAAGGRITLVPPADIRAEVPEPAWQVEGVDAQGGHLLREVEPEPFAAAGQATTGMTLVLTVSGPDGGTVGFDGPAALPPLAAGGRLPVSGGGKTDVVAAIWHPTKRRYLVVPGPMGYSL